MRRVQHPVILTLLAAALPILAAIHPTSTAHAAEGGPAAVVAEPVIDAGLVPVGEQVEAEFTIRNTGDAPLEITQVRPACGCTVAEYDEVIAPGGSGTVRAVVDTKSEVGANAKAITVYTNDPRNPRLQLTIKSDVRPFLTLDPGYARFTAFVHLDRDQSSPQLLWTDDFQGLAITGVESPQPWIEVSYREATAAERIAEASGRQWRVDVTLAKEAPVGPVADRVLVRTNHPRQAQVEIPVSGFVRPVVGVSPPAVDFGKVDPAEVQTWGILVRNFGSAPLEIQGVDSSVPGIRVEVEPLEAGQQYKLVFTPTVQMAKGPFTGRVEVRTNLPQQPTITVDLRGEVI
ncbi:MAG TPA: DUF1573 domain-containing protein [Thermoanaerobaculia bacterium]|nr:DUF1573 domain-containing protein [Thermoanaerobaculia bacterium]